MPRSALLLAAAPAVAVALLATGCGANGQPDALEACKSYTNATTGVVSHRQQDLELRDAEHWAGKAVDKSSKWQPLLDALRSYREAANGTGAGAGRERSAAKAAIQVSCEAAARGY